MIRNKFSLFNIYIWDVIGIVFFCIKFLPEIYDYEFSDAVIISMVSVVLFAVLTQIKILRHVLCLAVSVMWGFLISQTLEFYLHISRSVKLTVMIFTAIVFYVWHILFMENPFNIVSAVSIEAQTDFSGEKTYVPQYIPFAASDKSGSYITQYFREKEKSVSARENIFQEKIKMVKASLSDQQKISGIIFKHNENIKQFHKSGENIINGYNSGLVAEKRAIEQIDELYDNIVDDIKNLEDELLDF